MMLSSLSVAQERTRVSARAAEPRLVVSRATVIATSVIVTNGGTSPVNFEPVLVLPRGWRRVTPDPQFPLKAGESDTRLVSFSLPAETPAGTYEVQYNLRWAGQLVVVPIEIIVRPIRDLQLQILEAPRFVVAERDLVLRVALHNSGNVAGTLRLSFRSSDGFRVRTDSVRYALGPRETREIPVIVSTAGIPAKIATTTEIFAWFLEDTTVSARTSSVVDVIPQVSQVHEQMLEIPVEISGRMSGEDDRIGGQLEVYGGGSFLESRQDRIDFQIRTPDIQSQSSMGMRDEYRVHYRTGRAEVHAGDGSYTLSPLTELNRYAFGFSGSYSAGPVTAGGYYNELRFLPDPPEQIAGYVSVEVLKNYRLGVNYLRKRKQLSGEISSFRGMFKPNDLLKGDLEYGVSEFGGRKDRATALTLSGNHDWLNYDARYINAGPQYGGYYRNLTYTSLGINVSPLRLLRVEGYARLEERNRAKDTTLGIAPREKILQIGGGYSNVISAYYRISFFDDLLPSPLYRRREDVVQLRLGTTFKSLSLFSNIDVGTISDKIKKANFPFQRYAVFSGLSPTSSQTYTTSIEFTNERNLFTGEPLQRLSGSFGISYFIQKSTNAQLTVFLSRTRSPQIQDFGLVDATLSHVFPNQHRIALRARQAILAAPALREVAYTLEYGLPLSVPVARLSSSGQIRGKIVGQNGKGLPNVLVNVGSSAAVTDGSGEFFLPAVSPGNHFLIIDRASIGLEYVTRQQMPLGIDVRGGEETRLLFEVIRAAQISVSMTLYKFDEKDTTGTRVMEDKPFTSGSVEMSSGDEVIRRIVDSRGQVSVADLRPGIWTVRIKGELPAFSSPEQEVFEFNLSPGAHQAAVFRILPRRRTIRILQEAEVTPTEGRKGEANNEDCLISFESADKGFVLQVSSWVTRTKALQRARVAERVSSLHAKIERTDVPGMGIRYRVKVGPFRTRELAEKACREISALEQQ